MFVLSVARSTAVVDSIKAVIGNLLHGLVICRLGNLRDTCDGCHVACVE